MSDGPTLGATTVRDIASLGDVHGLGRSYRDGVLITIWRDGTEPLSGRVEVAEGDIEVFVGWLQLLGILSRVLEPARSGPSPGEGSGELDP